MSKTTISIPMSTARELLNYAMEQEVKHDRVLMRAEEVASVGESFMEPKRLKELQGRVADWRAVVDALKR